MPRLRHRLEAPREHRQNCSILTVLALHSALSGCRNVSLKGWFPTNSAEPTVRAYLEPRTPLPNRYRCVCEEPDSAADRTPSHKFKIRLVFLQVKVGDRMQRGLSVM